MKVAEKLFNFDKRMILIPFGDMQFGSPATDEARFDRLVEWIINKEDCYCFGVGDYMDLVIRQDLKRFTGGAVKSDLRLMIDEIINEERDLAIRKMKPLADAGKLLFLLEGNHETVIRKMHSYNVMADICKALNVENMGYSCLYRMTLQKGAGYTRRNINLFAHHGFGSSRRSGAALNKREDIIRNYDADIIVMGHDHHKFGKRSIRLGVTQKGKPRLIHKPVIIGATGSFMKSVISEQTTYAEVGGYPPNDIGVIRIDIRFDGKGEIDMHVSE